MGCFVIAADAGVFASVVVVDDSETPGLIIEVVNSFPLHAEHQIGDLLTCQQHR